MGRYVYRVSRPSDVARAGTATARSTTVSTTTAPEPENTTEQAETVNYSSLKKDELVALADERGIDSSGTKADIIARLEDNDG